MPARIFSPKVFISYRRDDSHGETGRLYDRLVSAFGKSHVVRDIDTSSQRVGQHYEEHLLQHVRTSNVMIVVIGKNWLSIMDQSGRRRLDDAGDLLRREVALALKLKKRVIPLLVGGTTMPSESDLPEDIKDLAKLEHEVLNDRSYDTDVLRLIRGIRKAPSARYSQQVAEHRLDGEGKRHENLRQLISSLKERAHPEPGLYWFITAAVIGVMVMAAAIIIWNMIRADQERPTAYFIVDATAHQQYAKYDDLRTALRISAAPFSSNTRIGLRVYGGDSSRGQDCTNTRQLIKPYVYSDAPGEIESVLSHVPAQGRGSLADAVLTAISSDLAGESGTVRIYALVSGVDSSCETMAPETLKARVEQTGRKIDFFLINVGLNDPVTEKVLKGYAGALSGSDHYIYTANAAGIPTIIGAGSYGYDCGYGYDCLP